MRKCKKCGVDISHRGNRSQYCEKHAKEIRDKKVKANKRTEYQRKNPLTTMIGKRRLPTGGRPLCDGDSKDSTMSNFLPVGTIDVSLHPTEGRIKQGEKRLKSLEADYDANPLNQYRWLYDRSKLSKSDYDKMRYKQKKIRELHEKQEASIKHKWRNRKPHPEFWHKQVDIINNPKYKDRKTRNKYENEKNEEAKAYVKQKKKS